MDFEIEKLLAKVSGKNVENFAACVISDADKEQINFAFEQMFDGLSLIQWMQGGLLIDAWNASLDKIRDFIFGLKESTYVVDYLRVAVFDFKRHKSKHFHDSVHGGEYFQSDAGKDILEKAAREKIQSGIDIIMSILPKECTVRQETKQKQNFQEFQKEYERENERVRERK